MVSACIIFFFSGGVCIDLRRGVGCVCDGGRPALCLFCFLQFFSIFILFVFLGEIPLQGKRDVHTHTRTHAHTYTHLSPTHLERRLKRRQRPVQVVRLPEIHRPLRLRPRQDGGFVCVCVRGWWDCVLVGVLCFVLFLRGKGGGGREM